MSNNEYRILNFEVKENKYQHEDAKVLRKAVAVHRVFGLFLVWRHTQANHARLKPFLLGADT
jgi:hypothetical protein